MNALKETFRVLTFVFVRRWVLLNLGAEVAKGRQKGCDSRWVKKNNQTHYGYKNHVKVDAKKKLVTKCETLVSGLEFRDNGFTTVKQG